MLSTMPLSKRPMSLDNSVWLIWGKLKNPRRSCSADKWANKAHALHNPSLNQVGFLMNYSVAHTSHRSAKSASSLELNLKEIETMPL